MGVAYTESVTFGRWYGLLCCLLVGGCTVPGIDLKQRRCPCAEGWVCDEERDLCVELLPDAGDGRADAAQPPADASDTSPPDGGPDASQPVPMDAGPDATPPQDGGQDASMDPAMDASMDAAMDAGDTGDGGDEEDAGEPDAGTPEDPGALAAGQLHTCAQDRDGEVWCWGNNATGQLGDGTVNSRFTPDDLEGLSATEQLSAGSEHSCALLSGQVRCWGGNGVGQVGQDTGGDPLLSPGLVDDLTGVVGIGAGWQYSCALLAAGTVQCWGGNTFAELGSDPDSASRLTPKAVDALSGAVELTAGGYHACARLGSGEVECWGRNDDGQLGRGSSGANQFVPVGVSGISDATGLAAGRYHTCALLQSGQVQCWGRNGQGQAGNPTSTADQLLPFAVQGLDDPVQIAAGAFHTCARLASGEVLCWGGINAAEPADDTVDNPPAIPVAVGVSDAVDMAAGQSHTCLRTESGSLMCWGGNNLGQLGYGTGGAGQSTPRRLNAPFD